MSIAIIAAAALSAGSPTYLECTIAVDGEPVVMKVAADEAGRRATISFPGVSAVDRLAVFDPEEVQIFDDETTWTISRVDLRLEQLTLIGERRFVNRGTCKVTPAPAERAF